MFWFLLFTKWQWKYFTRWFTSLNLKTLEQRQLLKPINCGTFATIKAFYHKIFGLFMRSKTKNWYRRCFNVTQQPLSLESVSALKWCSGQKRWEKKTINETCSRNLNRRHKKRMKWDHFQLDDDNVVMPICRIMQIQSSEHTHTHKQSPPKKTRKKYCEKMAHERIWKKTCTFYKLLILYDSSSDVWILLIVVVVFFLHNFVCK